MTLTLLLESFLVVFLCCWLHIVILVALLFIVIVFVVVVNIVFAGAVIPVFDIVISVVILIYVLAVFVVIVLVVIFPILVVIVIIVVCLVPLLSSSSFDFVIASFTTDAISSTSPGKRCVQALHAARLVLGDGGGKEFSRCQ